MRELNYFLFTLRLGEDHINMLLSLIRAIKQPRRVFC